MSARCAVCLASFQKGDPLSYRDFYVVHRRCLQGAIAKESELRNLTAAKEVLEAQVAQANKNARATMDHAQQIEARVFTENQAVHARVSQLEAELARERSARAAAEAALELIRRLPADTTPEKEISKPDQDASVVRFGLLELD